LPLSPGQVLNKRYRIVSPLGQGGFGAVYRAWDLNLERPCAVKENLDTTAEAQKQFKREAKILADLSHTNLPHVYDHFIAPGQGQYLVMDFVEGEDLQKMLESQGNQLLPEDLVMSWIGQVCDALIYLHSQNPPVIHRDIKPANIRITPDGKAMLVDFGISKVYDPNMKTTKGARAITHGYAPPEQYGTGKTDPQTDVYAIGATTYKLLTGIIPPASVDISTGNRPPPPPVDAENPSVTPGVSKAVEDAMQINRSDRTESVEKYKTAIVLAGSMVTAAVPIQHDRPETTPTGTPTTHKTQIPTWLPLTGAAVVLIVISLIIWNTLQGSDISDSEQTQTAIAMYVQTTETLIPTSQSPSPTTTYTNSPEPTKQPSPANATEPTDLSAQIVDYLGVPMVLVSAGAFNMGGNVDDALVECKKYQPNCERIWYEDEVPSNGVYLDDYYIDVYEVTNSRYQECENAGACSPPENTHSYTHSNYYGNPEFGNYPVIYVSWHDAMAYCGWRGTRLPTEAEWEKAARGGLEGKQYPWGDEDPVCRVGTEFGAKFDDDVGCNETDTEPVGRFSANGYGIYDMAGNVREWVNSLYRLYPYRADDGREDINTEGSRVLRDGSWFLKADNMRTSGRYYLEPSDIYSFIGFRCVRSP
jgi:formylglycine-generating enzyme required for sulfatase activity